MNLIKSVNHYWVWQLQLRWSSCWLGARLRGFSSEIAIWVELWVCAGLERDHPLWVVPVWCGVRACLTPIFYVCSRIQSIFFHQGGDYKGWIWWNMKSGSKIGGKWQRSLVSVFDTGRSILLDFSFTCWAFNVCIPLHIKIFIRNLHVSFILYHIS